MEHESSAVPDSTGFLFEWLWQAKQRYLTFYGPCFSGVGGFVVLAVYVRSNDSSFLFILGPWLRCCTYSIHSYLPFVRRGISGTCAL